MKLILGDCIEEMKKMPDKSVDLVITSPPYDNLREYKGYTFDFNGIANELFRIVKDGGVIVWVVGDATIRGSETGTSFKQALYFKYIGFNLHDTMIWNKGGFTAVGTLKTRYGSVFEYMFIFSKGKIKTFNPIKDRLNKTFGNKEGRGTIRQKDGSTKPKSTYGYIVKKYGQRFNIWNIFPKTQIGHPAPFPEQLAKDHIISWSNEGDTVLDPMMGSGTVGKMCKLLNRNFIGIEIAQEYYDIAVNRINQTMESMF